MKILALEFSSALRTVAVVEVAEHTSSCPLAALGQLPLPTKFAEVIESTCTTKTHPLRMAREALDKAGINRTQIDCIAVGLGPGSYTGIRAAIAIAQGWALASNIKLCGVSSMAAVAAVAWATGLRGTCYIIVDAQRHEFYLARYLLTDTGATETEQVRLAPFDQVNHLAASGCTVLGPQANQWFAQAKSIYPSAFWIARIAAAQNEFVPGEKLEPIYLREPRFVKAPTPRLYIDTG